ncbi:lysine--tRNA ligase [Patescibacteria group bacterium]|nr:lysine--tRNA ligase [Patescibacteria group bacterium]
MSAEKKIIPGNEKEERLKKLALLCDAGINPYPATSKRDYVIAQFFADFKELENNQKEITIAGRLRSMRSHGNLTFANLEDASGKIQLAFSKKELGDESYKRLVKLIDISDFIEVTGKAFVTTRGESSLMATSWNILSKAIAPIPDAWYGLKDDDDRYRQRYLDLLLNPETRDLFVKKALFWEVIRDFMKRHGFFEVETPTIETSTGGAEANPFKTHHDDFDLDVFMRISVGELWQKRLMAAGFEKVFEIGRVYRNEGSSPDHLQEFTNMEFYWAYANYEMGMALTQELFQEIGQKVFNKSKFVTKDMEYDLAGEWPRIDYRSEVLKQTGIDVLEDSDEKMKKKLEELGVRYEGSNRERLTDTLWKYCRRSIAGPAFLINHPKLVSPLSKAKEDDPRLTERFQVIIAGSEIANGFSELNDPIDQKERFLLQQELIDRGDKEAMMPDWEFVEMLEHGMPPTCGLGMGERLFAYLVNKSVRETTLFPLMRPKRESTNKKSEILLKNNK